MQTLESILSHQSQSIKSLQDLVKSDKFKTLIESYDFDKIKEFVDEEGITCCNTTVRFSERRIDILQSQHVSGTYGYIGRVNVAIASILLDDQISIRNINLAKVRNERELVEDLKKIFFNEE